MDGWMDSISEEGGYVHECTDVHEHGYHNTKDFELGDSRSWHRSRHPSYRSQRIKDIVWLRNAKVTRIVGPTGELRAIEEAFGAIGGVNSPVIHISGSIVHILAVIRP